MNGERGRVVLRAAPESPVNALRGVPPTPFHYRAIRSVRRQMRVAETEHVR